MAETQTVLWTRVLDRLAGLNPPLVACVYPRLTEVARQAEVHLAIRPGTNLALMNGLIRELLINDGIDHDYIAAHTIGFDELKVTVKPWTPEAVTETCGVDAADVRAAARIFAQSPRVLSTVLQGLYQASDATASACQVNNLHLLTGKIGRPGAGILHRSAQTAARKGTLSTCSPSSSYQTKSTSETISRGPDGTTRRFASNCAAHSCSPREPAYASERWNTQS